MPITPAARMNKTKIPLAMPHDTSHSSRTRPGPVKSGVDKMVRPTRLSTGSKASSTRPRNQPLTARRTLPAKSKKPGRSSAMVPVSPPGGGSVVVVQPPKGSATIGAVVGAVGMVVVVGAGLSACANADGALEPRATMATAPARATRRRGGLVIRRRCRAAPRGSPVPAGPGRSRPGLT